MSDHVAHRIWAHPVREQQVTELLDSLDADVPVIWDQVPTPSKEPAQRWRVLVNLLEDAASEGKPFVGWIQDDAIPCRDYVATVDAALTAAGSPILLSTYGGTGRPDQLNVKRAISRAEAGNHAFYSTRSLNFGVGVIIPTAHVDTVLRAASQPVFKHAPADYRVGAVLRDRCHLRTYYTLPSLCDHRDQGSLVGNGHLRRVAHRFHGTNRSGLDIDWTRLPPADTVDGRLNPNLR